MFIVRHYLSTFLLFSSVIDFTHLLKMVHLHQQINGGNPVPMDRAARCCGWRNKYTNNFRNALYSNQIQSYLYACYYRNTPSLVVTVMGKGFLENCENWHSVLDENDPNLTDNERMLLRGEI
jgi:hypothetical protein